MNVIEAVEALKQGKSVTYKSYTIYRDPLIEGRFAVHEKSLPIALVTCSSPENAIRFINRSGTSDYTTPMTEIDIEFDVV